MANDTVQIKFMKPARMLGKTQAGLPNVGSTETFTQVGNFATFTEMLNCEKYLHTKFVGAMVSLKKVTQHAAREVYEYVPLQDFTDNSDIDWSQDLAGIDEQLFDKYGLDIQERMFIKLFYEYGESYDEKTYRKRKTSGKHQICETCANGGENANGNA